MRGTMLMAALAAIGVVAGVVTAAGQGESQGERQGERQPGRYSMSPAEGGGFARLDTETGQMALCQRRDGDWSCREMAEPSRGLGQEVERLRAENKRLKDELRRLEDIALADKRPDGDRKSGPGGFELKLPTEQDVDQAMTYVQRMLKKFREKMREIESDQRGAPL